jgi:hypothetical protein
VYYYEIDYHNHSYDSRNYCYDYIRSLDYKYGMGIAWDENKSPMFLIEKVELECISEGYFDSYSGYVDPPHYEPVGVETIIVRPKLRRF